MKRLAYFLAIVLIASTFTSCKTFDTKFKSDKDSILYAARQNSIFSYGDRVFFFVNGKKIGELKGDKYFAIHLKPGKYAVRWRVESTDGKVLFDKNYGTQVFKAGVAYGTVVNHAVGAWRAPFKYYDVDIQGAIRRGVNLAEEIDLRKKIKPL